MNKKSNLHDGHRQRKKEQFLTDGIDNFSEHEVLEFLLYFSKPRGSTNELAHDLIDRFSSLVNVLNADYESLLEFKGVGENTACMICLFRMITRLFIMRSTENAITELNNTEALNNYCSALFLGAGVEQIYCIFLDDSLNLLNSEKICDGSLSKVEIKLLDMIAAIHKSKSSSIVIAHNHPNGSCMPSRTDVDVTEKISSLFKELGIRLIDHVIVGKDGVWSMRERNTLPDIW